MAFFESKQYVGLHDPRVRVGKSVERARPLAWFVQTLTVVWYAESGHAGTPVVRDEGGGDIRRHAVGVAVATVGPAHFAGTGRRTNPRRIAKHLNTPTRRRPVSPKHESEPGGWNRERHSIFKVVEWISP